MNITEATKERLEQLANEKGINFCRLATISGIPYTTIKSIIYNQSNNPGISTIKKICDGLQISITDFSIQKHFEISNRKLNNLI